MPSNETLLLIALILMGADLLIASDLLTLVAYAVFSFVVAREVPAGFLYQVLSFMAAYAVMVAVHYLVWRKVVQAFVDRFIAPQRYTSGIEAMIGKRGLIVEIEGVRFLKVDGDLWSFLEDVSLSTGETAQVTGVREGRLVLAVGESAGRQNEATSL